MSNNHQPVSLLSAAEFDDEIATTTVQTSCGPLAVSYRPYALTPKLEMALAKAESDDAFYGLFCQVVDEIGLTGPLYDAQDRNEAGEPRQLVAPGERIPIEPATVGCLPSRLLERIMAAIREDLTDGDPKASNGTSRAGSFVRR